MSRLEGSVPDLGDERRKRLRYRSWHRGMKETDLILGRFADQKLVAMNTAELDLYESLLGENDPDLFNWITGREAVPADKANPMLNFIREFYNTTIDN